jgi:ubiquinone/menaquinone biosynthesis C-methylase UbiE
MSVFYKSINERLIKELENMSKFPSVLEIGAANDSNYLCNVKSMYIKRNNIDYTLSNVEHFSAERIPYGDSSFDLIFMVATDYLIKDLYQDLNEFYRILRLDGQILIFTYKEPSLESLKIDTKMLKKSYSEFERSINNYFDTELIINYYDRKHWLNFLYRLLPKWIKYKRSPWIVKVLKKI